MGLRSSAFNHYEDNYAAIQEMRDIFNKQLALDAKIEKVEASLIVKSKMQKKMIQDELQRKFEKKLKKVRRYHSNGWSCASFFPDSTEVPFRPLSPLYTPMTSIFNINISILMITGNQVRARVAEALQDVLSRGDARQLGEAAG